MRTLVALGAASVLLCACGPAPEALLAMRPDGIGPLQLGRDYEDAVAATLAAAPDTGFAGLGCNGLDEVRFSAELGGLPVSPMAMAVAGRIAEIEVTLDAPLQAADEAACIALRDRFGAPFVAQYGPPGEARTVRKPVSREHLVATGPVVLLARWFPTGNSCYVSAHYGYQATVGVPGAW